jgi:hypothetical protein
LLEAKTLHVLLVIELVKQTESEVSEVEAEIAILLHVDVVRVGLWIIVWRPPSIRITNSETNKIICRGLATNERLVDNRTSLKIPPCVVVILVLVVELHGLRVGCQRNASRWSVPVVVPSICVDERDTINVLVVIKLDSARALQTDLLVSVVCCREVEAARDDELVGLVGSHAVIAPKLISVGRRI